MRRTRRLALVLARGGAVFLGVFVLVGLVGVLRGRQSDIALWFVDLRDLGAIAQDVLLAAFAAALVAWAIVGARPSGSTS